MIHPYFTIITVVKNGEKTIERCIKSVIGQDYRDKQYIVIDGASGDDTVSIIEKYREYIDAFISEPDDGIYSAMNKALDLSEGEVIYFLNSDDWLEPDALRRAESLFRSRETDIIAGHVYLWEQGRRVKINENMPEAMDYGTPYSHQGLFVRRSVFEEIGPFNTEYKICADYEWMLRAFHRGYSFTEVDDVFANYTIGGLSADNTDTLIELIDISEKNINFASDPGRVNQINIRRKAGLVFDFLCVDSPCKVIAELKRYLGSLARGITVWGAGKWGERCVSFLLDNGISVRQVTDSDPDKQGSQVRGITVVSPDKVDRSDKVLISVLKSGKDIFHTCIDSGFAEDNVLCLGDLIDHLYEEYVVRCGNGIK